MSGTASVSFDIDRIVRALQCQNPTCPCQKPSGGKWTVHCPAHDDSNPSLSLTAKDGKILFKCFGGCSQEVVIQALKDRNLWPVGKYKDETMSSGNRSNRATDAQKSSNLQSFEGCTTSGKPKSGVQPCNLSLTLAELSQAKKISMDLLQRWGVGETKRQGARMVRIPYMNQGGEVVGLRFRHSINGAQRFSCRKGDKVTLYGLWLLAEFLKQRWVLLVEGETDCWTCWKHNIPALGIPGKSTWRSEWAELIKDLKVYLWQEPDAPELPGKVAKDLPGLMVIQAPHGMKDLNEAHCQGQDIPAFVGRLKAQAIPAATILREQQDAILKELRAQAERLIQADDPFTEIKEAIRQLGYGGDLKPPLIVYLALTSRLLAMRTGSMPVHLLLVSQASAGKSYTLKTALSLFPKEAYCSIEAGSPRVLIYNNDDLQHRAVIFGEADSLPAGEDNPAASAIRNLLQDHYLHYDVVVRDPQTGKFIVKPVEKPGPTVLITTSTRRLGHQLDTRLFSLEINDNPSQIREALGTQARLEINGAVDPDKSLISYQLYLQNKAPWEVIVPFAPELAEEIGKQATAPRILRDFSRLLSLVKSVAIIRHQHRHIDNKGRLVATIEDYGFVYNLISEMYTQTITEASIMVRATVKAVAELGEGMTNAAVAKHLGVHKSTAGRHISTAIKHGWLINSETRKGYPAKLQVGLPLPEPEGLPAPDKIARLHMVNRGPTEGATVQHTDIIEVAGYGCTVAEVTNDIIDLQTLKAGVL